MTAASVAAPWRTGGPGVIRADLQDAHGDASILLMEPLLRLLLSSEGLGVPGGISAEDAQPDVVFESVGGVSGLAV